MLKIKLIFLFIFIAFVSLGQTTDNKNQNKLWVKHLNLITQEEEILEFDNIYFKSSGIKHTNSFNGQISNLPVNNSLKSLDLLSTITQNPSHPESSVLYLINHLNELYYTSTLISPKFVITAASDIYSVRNNLGQLNVASYNYLRGLETDHITFATDIYFFTTSWNTTADWEKNIALIKLNRPLGATLGWMGYGYDDDEYYKQNEFLLTLIEENTYNLKTFTAQPDIYRDDSFLFTYQQFIDGAPFYLKGGILHGVACFENHANDVSIHNGIGRITEQRFNTIKDIVNGDMPAVPDVMPLIVNAEPKIIEASKSLSDFSFYLHNYSQATFSGEIEIDIYISKDDVIDQEDLKIHTYKLTATMDPGKTFRVAPADKPRISLYTKPSGYFIGAVINTNDFNLQNNSTKEFDCDTIIVTNQYATNQISGKVSAFANDKSPGQCALLRYKDDHFNGIYDIVDVENNGEYMFTDVLLGVYNILFIPNPENTNDLPTYYNTTPYWDNSSKVTVVLSDTLKGINFNSINSNNLGGNKIISGTLTIESEKSATDITSNTLSDVCIYLHSSAQTTPLSFCRPNTAGLYRFNKLTAGTYQIKVDKPGYNLSSFHTLVLTDETDSISNINFMFSSDSTITAQNITTVPLLESKLTFSFYPNPATDKIYVETNTQNSTIQLFNLLGQKIIEYPPSNTVKKEIDINFLLPGSYVIKLKSDNNFKYSKMLIKK